MFAARLLTLSLLVAGLLTGPLSAETWLDEQGKSIAVSEPQLTLQPNSEQAAIQVGTTDNAGLWINATAGKKLAKSNYFTNRYKLDQPIDLNKTSYQVTVEKVQIASDEFKRAVIMYNSSDTTACGVAIYSDQTGDLVRLDTKGQFKVRKSIKFKLPATFTFVKEKDEVEIYLNNQQVSGKLTFPYEADAKKGGFISVDMQMRRVVGNGMATHITHGPTSKPQAKVSVSPPSELQSSSSFQPVHRVRTLSLPVDNSNARPKVVFESTSDSQFEIEWSGYVTLRGKSGDQTKTYAKYPAQQILKRLDDQIQIQLTQLGSFCFVRFNEQLLGMVPCDATDVSIAPTSVKVSDTGWQAVGLTPRHQVDRKQAIPKVAMQNVLGWLPPDTFLPSLINATHDFPVTPPVDNVHRDVRLMHETGWNVAAVDFTFFADYRVVRQYHMLREWLYATADEKLDDFYICPFLEVGTYSKQAQKSKDKINKQGRVEVDASFTAHAMIYLMEQYANHPNWLKFQGRPVFGIYRVNHNDPAYWQEVRDILAAYGWDPFIFGDLGSIQTAIYGTFDYDEWRPYGKTIDAIYTFSASLLEVSLDLPPKFRECFSPLKNPPVIGATVRPGYLSARPYNKNWISHRGTEIVVKSWEKALQYDPAFIHATTWNDYNEATQFANSFSLSTSQLEIGKYYLNQYFNKPPLQGKTNEPHTILSYFKVSHGNEPVRFRVLSLPTSQGAKKGQWQLTLTNDQGKQLASTTSDMRDLTKVDTWLWQWDGKVTKKQTRTVKVKLEFIGEKANKTYHHIPDIAMIDGNMYGDELYYLVPLHKLAAADKRVTIQVNSVTDGVARHESLVDLKLQVQGADPEKTHVSVAGNSNLVRLAGTLKQEGAWRVPSFGYHGVEITEGTVPNASTFIDVRRDDWAEGNNYYVAQAQFEDGTVAWSPTVYALPEYAAEDVSAQWVFSPRYKQDATKFIDRTQRQMPLDAAPSNGKVEYVRLPGQLDVMHLNGHQRFYTELTALPVGPMAMEVVFRPDVVNREQILCVQRGSQATLIIDTEGYLVARRLPQERVHPNPSVQVRSRQPLKANELYQAIVVYDGTTLKLYLNGQLESQAPCFGRRSTEMFVIGGPALPRSVIVDKDTISPALKTVIREIDGVHEKSFYKGLLVRLTLMSRPLSVDEVYTSFQRLASSRFWQ